MILNVLALLFLQKKGLTIISHSKQNTVAAQIQKYYFSANCTHVFSSLHSSSFVYKTKEALIISETFQYTSQIPSKKFMR